MISTIISLITSSNVAKYLIAAAAVIFVYFWWEHSIEQRAILKFNQSQIEQVLKDQKELSEKMTHVRNLQDEIIENEKKFKESIDKKLSGINYFLSSEEARKLDRPASEILKKTVRELEK